MFERSQGLLVILEKKTKAKVLPCLHIKKKLYYLKFLSQASRELDTLNQVLDKMNQAYILLL